jgi:hypothetical protein
MQGHPCRLNSVKVKYRLNSYWEATAQEHAIREGMSI